MADPVDISTFLDGYTGGAAPARAVPADDLTGQVNGFFDQMDELGKTNAKLNLFAANKENPDEAAKAQAMGRFIGLPPDVVERNMGEVEARVKLARQAKVLEQSPALVQWLQDGANARVAHDDFEKLSFIEKTMASITRGGTESILANERGRLGYEALGAGLTPDKAQRLATIDAQLKAPQGGDDDFFQHVIRTTSGLVAGFADQFTSAPVLAGSAFGAALGTVGGPLAPLTTPAGAAIGAAGGMVADGYRVGAGQIWLSLKDMRDGEGREIDPNVRTAAAIGGGLVLGFLNLVGAKGATGPTVEGIKGLVRAAVGEAVQRPTAAAALAQFGVGMAKGSATGVGFGAVNESTMIGAEQIARMLSSGDFATIANDPAQRAQALDRVTTAMVDMGLGFGAMHLPARSFRLGGDLMNARRSERDQAVLQTLIDGSADSATRERAPDAFARFIDQQADGSPVETLFIPAERLRELYQRFDLDPFELSDDPLLIGGIVPDFKQQLEQGLRTGGDVAVPLGQYIAKIAGTKVHDALKEDIRVRSDGLTQRELKDFSDRYKEAVDQAGRDAAERGAQAAVEALPGQRVADDVQRQSQTAGYTLDAARQHAALFRQRYETRAARMGFGDAYTHFQASGVRIERALPEELKRYTPNEVDAMLNEIRAGKKGAPPGRLIGPSLLEYLASKGGLKDAGGELKAMDADRWHRDKPFRRQLVQQETGLHFDEAAQLAHDEGYFPELQGKVDRPEISHLLDAIREELAGRPRRGVMDEGASDARAREQTKADLDQLIQSSGEIDLKKMSNREVRPILERLMGEADGKTLAQPGARGSITFGGGEAVIRLFRDRNLSTFVHESGHLFLEELMVDAAHPDAPAQVKADAAALLKWFGIDDAAKITTEHHEQLARAFEAYLLEGKAPSVELGGVFRRISEWLKGIYKTVANLNTPINDEVRSVFDRLLASDEQLTAAREAVGERRLFGSADEAGMTDAEFAAYNRTVERSRDTAESTLLKKLMGDVRRRFTAQWKAEESTVKEAVAREVDGRREVAALIYLRTGKMPGGEGLDLPHLRLSRDALVEMYGGPGILEQMPRGVPPIVVAKGGVHPDVVAETMGGFRSGRELVDALLAQQDQQKQLRDSGEKRSLRTYLIEEETNRRMVDRHGDMLNDGQIEQEALAALHSDRSLSLHAAELRMIGRRAGRSNEATPAQMAREWAARAIGDKTVKEAQQVGSYQRAERAAGHAVEKALLAQDYEEAFRQKQAQLLSHALWMEAKDASEQVDRGVRLLSHYADSETLKSMDQGYLEQIHGLLERFDLRQVTQKELARRASFAEWATRQQNDGVDVVAPASLMSDAFRTHYSDMTMGEFRGLVDTVKQVAHLGELKEQLTVAGIKRAFREVKDEALAAMSELRQRPVNDDISALQAPGIRGTVDRVGHYARMLNASLLKMETIIDWLDGGKEDGVFRRVVWQPIEKAQGERNVMLGEYTRKFLELRNGLDRDTQRRMVEVVDTPELINKETGRPWKMRLEQVASMALNWGNAGNREKLLKGYGWDEAAVKAVLDRHMTPDLWKFTQSAWDLIETLWPKIEELERRVNGVAPDKVERVKVDTAHGAFEGGYFPVVYDPNKSFHIAERMAESLDSLFPKDYGRATTAKGFTKERINDFAAPMHLSLDVLPRHIAEVIHDITHREVLMQADKFLSDREIQKGVADALGREYVDQFKPWLQHIASEYAQDRRELSAWDSLVKSARMRASMVGLGFRITTILQQPFGLMDTAEVIGARWVGSGLAEAYGNPMKWKAARDFVFERSSEMANRINESERDIRDQMRQLVGRSGLVADARRFAYYGIAMMDMSVAIPSWLGGYRKALHEGMSETDAATYANGVVRQSQGAGGAKDLAAVQRGTETMKLATMFYSYFSHYYQRQANLVHDARGASAKDIPHLLARAFFLMVAPGLASALVSGQGPTEDEEWGAWAVRKTAVGLFMGVPGLRDIASWADHKISGQYARDYQYTPVTRIVDVFGKTVDDLWNATAGDGEVSDKWVRHALETSGYIFGLPTGQAASTFGFLSDVIENREQPENVGEWLKGLVYGKTKDK